MNHLPQVFQEIFNTWIPPEPAQLYAHLFKRSQGYELHLSETPNLCTTVRVERCSTKPAARKLATSLNAKPWNF